MQDISIKLIFAATKKDESEVLQLDMTEKDKEVRKKVCEALKEDIQKNIKIFSNNPFALL